MKLKPGDLALIIGYVHLPENVGKVCELVEMILPNADFVAPDGRCCTMLAPTAVWLVVGEGLMKMEDYSRNGSYTKTIANWTISRPEHLMPLHNTPEQVSNKQQEELVV